MDVVPRRRRPGGQGQAALHQGFQQGKHKQVFEGGDLAAGAGHGRLHAGLHVGHHLGFVLAPAAVDVGHGQAPGIALLEVEAHLVVVLAQHFAMADQEAHRLAGPALERRRRIEALDCPPEAVAPQEVLVGTGAQVHRVGDEDTARPRQFGWPGGRLIRQGKKAAGGDVVHQAVAEQAGGVLQAVLLVVGARVQQDPQAFDRRGAEHHQGGAGPLGEAALGSDEHHAPGPATAGLQLHMAHHGATAQAHPTRGQGLLEAAPLGAGAGPGGGARSLAWQGKAARMDQGQVQLPG